MRRDAHMHSARHAPFHPLRPHYIAEMRGGIRPAPLAPQHLLCLIDSYRQGITGKEGSRSMGRGNIPAYRRGLPVPAIVAEKDLVPLARQRVYLPVTVCKR